MKNMSKCKATTVEDFNTYKLTLHLRSDLKALFNGLPPATVLNNLARSKFDANRDEAEATFGIPAVQSAFLEYNGFIDRWKQLIVARRGFGLFIDLHGHGHTLQRAELGYLPRGSDLDSGLPINPKTTSIQYLATRSSHLIDFNSLLRGNGSFGAFLENYGFESVPSPKNPGPGSKNIYFNGGYLTRRHGSCINGTFDAIQIESAWTPRSDPMVKCYARALACTIRRYVCTYYIDSNTEDKERESCTTDPWKICSGLDCQHVRSGSRGQTFLTNELLKFLVLFAIFAVSMLLIQC